MNFDLPDRPQMHVLDHDMTSFGYDSQDLEDYGQACVKHNQAALLAEVKAICTSMFNCDMNGSPVDEHIPRWKVLQLLGEE
jgi:hypothetical protein